MKFKLKKNKWYAWQMFTGYTEEKYHSPIKILDISQSMEADLLVLSFYNACLKQGSKDLRYELKILAHSA